MANKYITLERLELFFTKLKSYIPTYLSDNSYVKDTNYVHTDNNYTTTEKTKLSNIESGANKYVLPAATTTALGGVKVGDNLSVAADGTISASSLDWSNVKNKPTKLSQFTNDGVFITNTTNNLTNYYKKTETYSQTEINNMISKMASLQILVVDALPATGENGTIYLVAHSHTSGDSYDEYIWVSSKSAFEKIGNTDIDLSNYWTKTELVECTEDEIIKLFA